MEDERDILVFVDEEENEIEMEILDYFYHEDQEYALLTSYDKDCDCDDCNCDEKELYIMKVILDGDTEEFLPVEEDKMEALIQAVEALYGDEEDEEE